METPKAMQGTWTLTAPDGRTWSGDSPIRTVALEQRDRVPAEVALQRIYAANDQPPQQHILDQIERCRSIAYAAGHHFAQHGAHDPTLMTKQAQDEALLIHLIEEYASGVQGGGNG